MPESKQQVQNVVTYLEERLTNSLPIRAHEDVLGNPLQVTTKLALGVGNPARLLVVVRLLHVLRLDVGLDLQPWGGVGVGPGGLLDMASHSC